jgi:hypothetical protein
MVSAVIVSTMLFPLRATPVGFAELRERYIQEIDHHPDRARRTLLEIGRLGDPAAIPFLLEAFRRPPMYPSNAERDFPERNFKSAGSIAGMAQVALAMLGDEERWAELEAEATSRDVNLRLNALLKIKFISGERAVELLSSFLGDREVEGDKIYLPEWGALFELTKRLDNPPFPVSDLSDLHPGYYSEGGEEKWLRWRFENYGPIPGREELFAAFVNESPAGGKRAAARETTDTSLSSSSPPSSADVPESPTPAAEPTADETPQREDREPDRRWLWLSGGVAALLLAGWLTWRRMAS